jgi:hypothetical protein
MAGKRTSLASLVAQPADATPPAETAIVTPMRPEPEPAPPAPAAAAGEETARGRAAVKADAKPAHRETPKVPPYLQLVRKETRIRERQYDDLTDLARRLERRRPTKQGERITENTLIRVAIDLLLEKAGRLDGHTEDEIRRSASS